MKNKFFYLFFCLSFLFVGCDTFFNNVVSEMIDYSVQAFNEDSVILRWDSDTKDARFNIYVKDKDDQVKCLEKKYAKSNWWKETASTGIGEMITIRTVNTLKKIVIM